jgi:hypothetical protein
LWLATRNAAIHGSFCGTMEVVVRITRGQFYDFEIYIYHASVVVGLSVFQSTRKYICFQKALVAL